MLLWVVFFLVVIGLLFLDLGVFHRKSHEVGFKEALAWSAVWISVALAFNLGVYLFLGPQPALQFLTGYLIEKSLSVDNLFVFALIFSYFGVPAAFQHRVLFWGVAGALVFRALFIAGGIALIQQFHWTIYLFGGFLVYTGIKMAVQKEHDIQPDRNRILRLLRRVIPTIPFFEGQHFFVHWRGRFRATPLLITLVFVELTDILFAVDSIPAILAITQDPFLVYTSNVFAILGLRAMYFALAGMLKLFHHLRYGLAIILSFVGFKLLVSEVFKMPASVSLGFVAAVLGLSIAASIMWPRTTGEAAVA